MAEIPLNDERIITTFGFPIELTGKPKDHTVGYFMSFLRVLKNFELMDAEKLFLGRFEHVQKRYPSEFSRAQKLMVPYIKEEQLKSSRDLYDQSKKSKTQTVEFLKMTSTDADTVRATLVENHLNQMLEHEFNTKAWFPAINQSTGHLIVTTPSIHAVPTLTRLVRDFVPKAVAKQDAFRIVVHDPEVVQIDVEPNTDNFEYTETLLTDINVAEDYTENLTDVNPGSFLLLIFPYKAGPEPSASVALDALNEELLLCTIKTVCTAAFASLAPMV